MKTLVIMTGPQGAGNHLFSKVLADNPAIWGWNMQSFWEGHHQEPFSDYWQDPTLLSEFNWSQSDHYVTSVSCPYWREGRYHIPEYQQFAEQASQYATVKIILLGRDQNILRRQQQRLRGEHTTPALTKELDVLKQYPMIVASQELLHLYQLPYVNWIEQWIGVAPRSSLVLTEDANAKYIHDAPSAVAEHVQAAIEDSNE